MPVPPVIQMYRYVMGSGGLGNLLKASEEFQQTRDWVRYPSDSQTPTVNDDSRPDPNGGGTADQVGFTANTSARLQQTVTLSASTQYTFSVYARAVSGTVDFRMRNVTLKETEVKTATTTGPDGGGFTRFTYTFTTGAAGSYELALQNAAGTPTERDVIFWGAMLNQGGTALDYQYAAPTTGGSAPAPAYAGFGDSFGGVTAYYSLRQFTEAETLNAIRVRRSSDDTEQDIGFDANGDLDTTALLAFVNEDVDVYTSDFSSTEDLSESNGTGAAAQSVGGVEDAYEFTLSGGAVTHYPRVLGVLNTSDTFNISFDFYIPSSNSSCDGIQLNIGGSPLYNTLDAWTSVSLANVTSTSDQLRFFATDGGSLSVDGDGDVFYLKNIVITQTTADGAVTTFYDQSGNGNDATNSTASEQPLVVSAGTLVTENGKAAIEFDGVDDWLDAGLSSSQFSQAFVVKNTTGTGTAIAYSGAVELESLKYNTSDDDITFSSGSGLFTIDNINVKGYLNGVDETGAATTFTQTFNRLYFGSINGGGSFVDGKIQEYIHFPYASDQSANLGTITTGGGTLIQGNINTYFDIV